MIVMTRYSPRVPGSIVALILGTVAVSALGLGIETVAPDLAASPRRCPALPHPISDPSYLGTLLSPALTVAMLGAIESLMSAVVADRMTGDRHDPNVELVAQGVANIASPLVGGLPATGAIARTAINIRSGARTPVAGIIHSLTLLAVLLAAAPLARHVPLAVLAAILLMVAWNMGSGASSRTC